MSYQRKYQSAFVAGIFMFAFLGWSFTGYYPFNGPWIFGDHPYGKVYSGFQTFLMMMQIVAFMSFSIGGLLSTIFVVGIYMKQSDQEIGKYLFDSESIVMGFLSPLVLSWNSCWVYVAYNASHSSMVGKVLLGLISGTALVLTCMGVIINLNHKEENTF